MGRKGEKEDPWGEKEDPWGEKGIRGEKRRIRGEVRRIRGKKRRIRGANNRFPDFLHRVGYRSAATDLLLIFATISIKSLILTGFLFLS